MIENINIFVIVGIAVGLSMDAFAVSVVSGFVTEKLRFRHAFKVAFFFGLFQAVMPVLGYVSGFFLREKLSHIDHWVAFIILSFIGGKMIYEAFLMEEEEDKAQKGCADFKTLIFLSVATSIDAFAVGLSLTFLNVPIIFPAIIIGIVTFILSLLGVYIGKKFGHLWENQIEIIGGVILILIGVKILFDHNVFG